MSASLQPYHSGPSASRSSHDITTQFIAEESYALHSLSVQDLPATLPSTNPSVLDLHVPGLANESPNQSPCSSRVFGDVALSSILLSSKYPRISPGTPEEIARYNRNAVVPDEPTQFTILPLTTSLLPATPPPGWTAYLHPEGAQYFFHKENLVFTDANLFNDVSLELINTTIRDIQDFIRAYGVQLAPDVNLVLEEFSYSDNTKGCQYYFVNHRDRSVFWMDHVVSKMFSITHEANGITSASHIRASALFVSRARTYYGIGHELEAQYWYHCGLFPRSLEVTHKIVDELRGIVLHALGDLLTSELTSTVDWKIEELKHMLDLIAGLDKNVGKDVNGFGGSSCLVGRLMCPFVRARVYNFHGEPAARLNLDQSVHAIVRKRTWLIKALGPLLFYAPDFHLVSLYKIYTDGLIRHRSWSEFITRLNREWQEFTLYATVLLNANVALLAIQSVDQGGNSVRNRSPTQISSYLSMLTSIGAIIIGLLLVKQNRDRDREMSPDTAQFISNRTHPTLGLETLAVLYSLPYAMLIWSMVLFLAAFSFMCFENSSLVTRALVAVLWGTVAALILWCIFTAWESGDWDWLRKLACCRKAAGKKSQTTRCRERPSPRRPNSNLGTGGGLP
ncbi:hypothetical protein C8R44DRAFT_880416 [Mycena epipterygia]|nr:hypothetical protein C8R44DRAFT_880416 [Mycena epipterygia]